MVIARDSRTTTQVLFSRKREVDNWPSLTGGQEIDYPGRRNTRGKGYLSAMLCKACVVALKGDVIGVARLEKPGTVTIRSRSQSGTSLHHSFMAADKIWLPKGSVTYLLGLNFLGEALAANSEAKDLLDALEEILEYEASHPTRVASEYDRLLMHLSDELYYWAKWRQGDPIKDPERLDKLEVLDATYSPEVTVFQLAFASSISFPLS